MKYKTGTDFRKALEKRLLDHHRASSIPLSRLRKTVAFDRFLARLVESAPDKWILKGGFLMELNFRQRARTTKDIDLLCRCETSNLHSHLVEISKLDLNDWFSFEVSRPLSVNVNATNTLRFPVRSLLDSRTFESFHLDVNTTDILFHEPFIVNGSDLLGFAGLQPVNILAYPLTQQIAEKFHALTRNYESGEASRVKALVDILLIAGECTFSAKDLRKAVVTTFKIRKTHDVPIQFKGLAQVYAKSYTRAANQVGITQKTLNDGNKALGEFLTPIISGKQGKWLPDEWRWA